MKLKFVQYLVCLLLLGGMSAQAQVYRTAIGARFEEDAVGFSVAQKVGRKVTMEGILIGNNLDLTQGYLLAKRHFGLFQRRLNVYLGAGAHTGFGEIPSLLNGYDAVMGAEFTLLRVTIAADVKPEWTFSGLEYQGLNPSVSLRYSLVRDRNSCNNNRNRNRNNNGRTHNW
ncbi:MAG: hypothetical protein NWR72_13750 [Bacteroidia bacterium]|nr:hypothetical protein [Bacteroidia bacterium]